MRRLARIIGTVNVDGREVDVIEGDTLGASLVRAGLLTNRRSITGEPRGMYCGMGACSECVVRVDGVSNVRACMTIACPGSTIETGSAG